MINVRIDKHCYSYKPDSNEIAIISNRLSNAKKSVLSFEEFCTLVTGSDGRDYMNNKFYIDTLSLNYSIIEFWVKR